MQWSKKTVALCVAFVLGVSTARVIREYLSLITTRYWLSCVDFGKGPECSSLQILGVCTKKYNWNDRLCFYWFHSWHSSNIAWQLHTRHSPCRANSTLYRAYESFVAVLDVRLSVGDMRGIRCVRGVFPAASSGWLRRQLTFKTWLLDYQRRVRRLVFLLVGQPFDNSRRVLFKH